MKIFFFPALTFATCMIAACNDNNRMSDAKDSVSAMTDSSAISPVAESSTVSKTGLPMSASQEVPANSSTATGNMDVSYNKDNHFLKYTVNWSGLTDKPTMAHIHGTAAKGVNAGVQHDLTGVLSKETAGSFTDSVMVDGKMIQEDSLMKGFYYINIHTPKNPGGEIRGQIEF
jgi:hypothetical protein